MANGQHGEPQLENGILAMAEVSPITEPSPVAVLRNIVATAHLQGESITAVQALAVALAATRGEPVEVVADAILSGVEDARHASWPTFVARFTLPEQMVVAPDEDKALRWAREFISAGFDDWQSQVSITIDREVHDGQR